MKRPTPWRNPEVGDIVVTKASGGGHGPARRREITGLTAPDTVEYADGRYYTRWVRGEGWMQDKGTSCVRSSWAAWCSKHAVEYWRGGDRDDEGGTAWLLSSRWTPAKSGQGGGA